MGTAWLTCSVRPRKETFEERAAALKGRLQTDKETLKGIDEKPLTVKQAAEQWGQSTSATRRHFAKVLGVRKPPSREGKAPGKRKYTTLLIPPSVLEREIRKYTKLA
jgi:hypothetical protein